MPPRAWQLSGGVTYNKIIQGIYRDDVRIFEDYLQGLYRDVVEWLVRSLVDCFGLPVGFSI